MIRSIVSYFTLKFVGSSFIDVVSGKMVCEYKDRYGDIYLKDSRWSTFSIKKKAQLKMEKCYE